MKNKIFTMLVFLGFLAMMVGGTFIRDERAMAQALSVGGIFLFVISLAKRIEIVWNRKNLTIKVVCALCYREHALDEKVPEYMKSARFVKRHPWLCDLCEKEKPSSAAYANYILQKGGHRGTLISVLWSFL